MKVEKRRREVETMVRGISIASARGAAGIAAAILVLIAVSFVTISLVRPALAAPVLPDSGINTLQGRIVAVDNSGYMTILTVRSPEIGRYPNNEMNVFTNDETVAKICSSREPAKDVRTGNATISYQEVGGVAVARSISERC